MEQRSFGQERTHVQVERMSLRDASGHKSSLYLAFF